MLMRRSIDTVRVQPGHDVRTVWLIRTCLGFGVLGLLAYFAGSVAVQLVALAAMMIAAAGAGRLAALCADDQRERAGWNWFALCFVFIALYSIFSLPHGEQLRPSTDFGGAATRILTLFAYLSSLAALAFAVRVPRGFLARLLLDTGVVLIGGTVIMAEILQQTSITVSSPELSARLLYRPLADLAIISLVAIALASMPRTARLYPSLVRGMAALGCLFVGHMGASVAVLRDVDAAPGWTYVFYMFAAVLFAASAYRYVLGQRVDNERQPAALEAHNPLTHSFWFHIGNAIVPYTIAMSAATLLFIRALRGDDTELGAQLYLLGALAFIAVGGLRHVLSHAENRNLYRHMSELNRGLEDLVEQRTAELVHRNEELEAVHKVATVSAVSLDLNTVLHAVAEQLTHVVGASMCLIHERTGEGTRVVARYERGNPASATSLPSTGRLRERGVNLLHLPRSEFEPVGHRSSVVKRWDLESQDPAAEILDSHGATVALVVPLVARDQTVGIAEIYRTSPETFSDSEVSLAEAVTTQAALATENARAFGKARFAANHDPVTGLLNHRALHEELRRLFGQSVAGNRQLSVVMMDLNMFKEFNDRFGHQTGDAVLTDIGKAITASMPSSAITARYGGDEFTALVPDIAPEHAQIFVDSIRERLVEIQDHYGFNATGFGIAVGIASYPADGSNLNRLVSLADERMYQDKRRTKGLADRRSSRRSAFADAVPPINTSADSDL